jgi:hypothetical protein
MVSRVFIVAGQSNAAGQNGVVVSHLIPQDAGIKIWTGAAWVTLINGTNNQTLASAQSTAGYWGPESQFAYLCRQAFPSDTIYILKHAVGSTAIAYYLPGGVGYTALTSNLPTAYAALTDPVTEALIWYQGEQDATTSAMANAYQANLEALDAVLKTTWRGNETTRFLCAQINPGDGRPFLSTVRAAQAAFCAVDPATRKLNDATGYAYQPDTVHVTGPGLVSCGADMYANYTAARRSRMVWG